MKQAMHFIDVALSTMLFGGETIKLNIGRSTNLKASDFFAVRGYQGESPMEIWTFFQNVVSVGIVA